MLHIACTSSKKEARARSPAHRTRGEACTMLRRQKADIFRSSIHYEAGQRVRFMTGRKHGNDERDRRVRKGAEEEDSWEGAGHGRTGATGLRSQKRA